MNDQVNDPPPNSNYNGILILIGLFVFGLLVLGTAEILPGAGAMHDFTVLLISATGATTFFAINKRAITVGAPLAASGDNIALIACILWFSFVAAVVGTVTYTGMTRWLVEMIRLESHGTTLNKELAEADAHTIAASTLIPLANVACDDLEKWSSCEATRGCLSGRPSKGSGQQPVTEFMKANGERCNTTVSAVEKGNSQRKLLVRNSIILLDNYSLIVEDQELGPFEKRSKCAKISRQVKANISELKKVMAVGTVKSLIADFRNPPSVANNKKNSNSGLKNAQKILLAHADNLEEALAQLPNSPTSSEAFPAKAGITAGFDNAPETWPYMLLSYGLEGASFMLWLFTYLQYRNYYRSLEKAAQAAASTQPHPTTNWRFSGPLGPHPHPNATKSRSNGHLNNEDDSTEGSDQ